jgi:membrane protein implicated in regulation of membrane protease activity
MEWSLTHFWLILALALSLAELTSGVLLLLALGVAAALTALVASLGASFEWQLVAMGVLSGSPEDAVRDALSRDGLRGGMVASAGNS